MKGTLYEHPKVYDSLYDDKDYAGEVAFVLDRFAAQGNGGDRALVVGCGTGRHSARLLEAGFQVTGIDPNPRMLASARNRSDATFREGGLPTVDVEGSFDLIWAPFTVMNYLDPHEFTPAVQAMDRTLAGGGIIVFDIGDFPVTDTPALQFADGDDPVARIYWYRRPDNTHVRMDAIVFHGDEWFADRHTLTDYPTGVVAEYLRDLGFDVDVHDWYGTPTDMPNPAVLVAYDRA